MDNVIVSFVCFRVVIIVVVVVFSLFLKNYIISQKLALSREKLVLLRIPQGFGGT